MADRPAGRPGNDCLAACSRAGRRANLGRANGRLAFGRSTGGEILQVSYTEPVETPLEDSGRLRWKARPMKGAAQATASQAATSPATVSQPAVKKATLAKTTLEKSTAVKLTSGDRAGEVSGIFGAEFDHRGIDVGSLSGALQVGQTGHRPLGQLRARSTARRSG